MKFFWTDSSFHDSYFKALDTFFQFDKRTHFFDVDFSKPWYFTLLKRRYKLALVVISEVIQSSFESLIPIALGVAISQTRYDYILYIVVGYIVLEIFNRLVVYINGITTAEVQGSIALNAHNYFLTVDPVYHTTKSSGAIVSKMQAGGREFIMMINSLLFNILPTISSYITVTLTLVYFNSYLGFVATLFFVFITLFTTLFKYINSNSLIKKWIKAREKYAGVTTENLIQNALIRSSFATVESVDRTQKLVRQAHNARNVMFMGGAMVTSLSRLMYILSVLIIGYGVLDLVQKGSINTVIGTTIVLTYMAGSRQVLRLGDTVGDITESMGNVQDMFDFINTFGKQTYPVLPDSPTFRTNNNIQNFF